MKRFQVKEIKFKVKIIFLTIIKKVKVRLLTISHKNKFVQLFLIGSFMYS